MALYITIANASLVKIYSNIYVVVVITFYLIIIMPTCQIEKKIDSIFHSYAYKSVFSNNTLLRYTSIMN